HYTVPGSLAALAFNPPATVAGGLLRWRGSLQDLITSGGLPVLSAVRFIVRGNELIRRMTAASPGLTPDELARALAAEPPLADDPAFTAMCGRTVFVGANASGIYDVKPTPVGKFEPGTLIHRTAWANLAGGGFIRLLPRATALGLAVAGSLLIIGAGRFRPGVTLAGLVTAGFCIVVLAGAYAAMSFGWFLPPATAIVAATLTLLGVAVESFWTEQRRKREIQTMFGSYVDPAVVELLLRDPEAIRLGGERRDATVYFSDLVGFTDLAEKIPAEQLVAITNMYLQEMSDCLIGYGAYIDKYIGDAVMAVFGAPQATTDHALAGCRGALAARGVLAQINERLAGTQRRPLRMRIGINTGEMIVGNVGSARKRNYTVLGDAVNLASRLEAANKEFGTEILLGERTARAVADEFVTRPLTRLRVKGTRSTFRAVSFSGKHQTSLSDLKTGGMTSK
ncbi:MAG: adenylate/guanylate cyclase domain-containing protein, partial [Opitutaceae bacterium]